MKGFTGHFSKKHFVLLCLATPSIWASPKKLEPQVFKPNPIVRPLSPTVQSKLPLKDSVEFIYNRGVGKVHMMDNLVAWLNPSRIKKIKGYKSAEKTRVTLMAYEIDAAEALTSIEELLEEGFQVRVVRDSGTYTLFEPLSVAALRKLNQAQKNYYLSSFDKNHDGKVEGEDALTIDQKHVLSIGFDTRLKILEKKFKSQLEIVSNPYTVVPEEGELYTSITHLKLYQIAFEDSKGQYVAVDEIVSSNNLTPSCSSCRINPKTEDQENYLNGKNYSFARGSQGHAQFGAIISGPEVLSALNGPIENWIEKFKAGKRFDDLPPLTRQYPMVAFKTSPGNSSRLQAFYSEGDRADSLDPIWALSQITAREDIEIEAIYDAQFVYTHKQKARHFRSLLARGDIKEFKVYVDSNFASERYSALPDLLFAPKVTLQEGVLSFKSIQDLGALPESLEWSKHIFVYNGRKGVFGGVGDKLHSKILYLRYRDSQQQLHHVVMWGSANSSSNAGKLNADAVFLLDSTESWVGESVMKYFKGLEKDDRMERFSESYLHERFLESMKFKKELFDSDFMSRFAKYLDQPKATARTLKSLVKILNEADAANSLGQNLLEILNWYVDNIGDRKLAWDDFYLMTVLAWPHNTVPRGFIEDLKRKWLGDSADSATPKSFEKLINGLKFFAEKKNDREVDPFLLEVVNGCQEALERLNVPVNAKSKGGQ